MKKAAKGRGMVAEMVVRKITSAVHFQLLTIKSPPESGLNLGTR